MMNFFVKVVSMTAILIAKDVTTQLTEIIVTMMETETQYVMSVMIMI